MTTTTNGGSAAAPEAEPAGPNLSVMVQYIKDF